MSPCREEIHELGREYVNYVNTCFQRICGQGNDYLPIWNLTGDAYTAPRLTNIKVNGKDVSFDLAYSVRRPGITTPNIQLYVEAKGSYTQATINSGFKDFLNKIFSLKELILKIEWKGTQFVFVSPIIPTSAKDPRIFLSPSKIKRLFAQTLGCQFSDSDDIFFETISKRIFILQLPMENRLIMLGGD